MLILYELGKFIYIFLNILALKLTTASAVVKNQQHKTQATIPSVAKAMDGRHVGLGRNLAMCTGKFANKLIGHKIIKSIRNSCVSKI